MELQTMGRQNMSSGYGLDFAVESHVDADVSGVGSNGLHEFNSITIGIGDKGQGVSFTCFG